MKPVSPVVRGHEGREIVFAKDQPEYLPLPALVSDEGGMVISRWRLSFRERVRVFLSGDMYLWVMTYGQQLQPMMLETKKPHIKGEEISWLAGA
jgi:hypothetical protein